MGKLTLEMNISDWHVEIILIIIITMLKINICLEGCDIRHEHKTYEAALCGIRS